MLNINNFILTKLINCIDTGTFNVVKALNDMNDLYTSKPSLMIGLDDDIHLEFTDESTQLIELREISYAILLGFKGNTDTSQTGTATDTANTYIDVLRNNLRNIDKSSGSNVNFKVYIKSHTFNIIPAVDTIDNDNAVLVQGKIKYQLTN